MKKRMSLQDKAERAMQVAIEEVVERHKKSGRPLATWSNGKVIRVSAEDIGKRKS